jgi:hypothetical protein
MIRTNYIKIELLVILLALAAGIYSQSSALVNKYVINDDAMQHIYWMRQFQNQGLFNNDLLTENARYFLPWGFVFLYRAASYLIDPLIVSKFLSLILFPISAMYVYKLLKQIANSNYTGFIGAVIFIITATFYKLMIGGHPRAFGFPLLIIFFYYLVRKQYLGAAIVMILQSLLYPVVFLLSTVTYLCTFIKIREKKIYFDKVYSKIWFFILATLIGCSLLISEYIISYNHQLGTMVSRQEVLDHPVFYQKGRFEVLPISPLLSQIKYNLKESIFGYRMVEYFKENIINSEAVRRYEGIIEPFRPDISVTNEVALIFFVFLLLVGIRKKISFPPEIYYLFLSGILWYWISDYLLFKLYRPERYLQYSVRIIGLIFFSVVIGRLIGDIKNSSLKKFLKIATIVLVLLFFHVNKNLALVDLSQNKELYEYLSNLPEDIVIAAHPCLADGIPIFTQKKVFINFELSNPWYNKYWEIVKKRTFDFFNAYYSEKPRPIYEFCNKNGIDYLVVDKKHFQEGYLTDEKVYFEPFQRYISNLLKNRKHFILPNMEEQYLLFQKSGITVIGKEVFEVIHDSN